MDSLYLILNLTLISATPILIVAIGGLFSERSGVANIALEGVMLMGAFLGIYVMNVIQTNTGWTSNIVYIIAMLAGGLGGALFSLLHAYACVSKKANQIISGSALNIFAVSFTVFFARFLTGTQQINFMDTFMIDEIPVLGSIPFFGEFLFSNIYISTYIALVIFGVSYVVLYKTRFGLRLRSVGDNPQAGDSAGFNIYFYRYAGVTISGFLAGIGGVALLIPTTTNFNGTVSGYGYLALAVLILGQWDLIKIIFAALFFGLMVTVSTTTGSINFLKDLNLSSDWYNMIPYVATIVVLTITSKNAQAPKSLGEPYDKGKR